MKTISDCKVQVLTLDGMAFGGATFGEVVAQMRANAFGGSDSDGVRGYMKQVAKRVWDWSAKTVRISTPEMFLSDMNEHGMLKLVVKS